MDEQIKFQTIFPIYCQARPKINEIKAAGAAAKASNNTNKNKFSRPPNKSDRESTELTSLLLAQIKALGVTLRTRVLGGEVQEGDDGEGGGDRPGGEGGICNHCVHL
ncbi:uncharacterized protein MELLADRAFT_112593 [Melampsora larici-populina 98AG31]|uniref:Uncharacterized protein n=1 Tax=Melampsora larici-populina (strain 98AG31 / pathotype 3-4-7) TaxID=747676 RepID=F4S6Z5_MELLP|nr:uncharacterized protein MELLADRAFT_112593 [Melampsora larici-populina 98AG31]EGF99546.1 hypothetical protein MELLADRAFT_112593 [Melampsora larici-populina 98AG31]